MARYTGAKNRIARRFGVNMFGRTRNPMTHKAHPAGMHGAKRKKKSDFGVQLEEKQKLKAAFGMLSESQLNKYFKLASKRHGNTPEIFMQFLESRLDIVVFRLKFASTFFGAQQLVAHGHITVDGKRVDIRSFQVRPGMVIAVKEKSKKMKSIVESIQSGSKMVPEYIEVNEADMSGKMMNLPSIAAIPMPIAVNIPMVCDFLAHAS
ncbi:MAG: 30S ribosomal protein S4 [Chlamydia sp.]